MKRIGIILLLAALLSAVNACGDKAVDLIRVENGQLVKHGKPYYFVGTNFWYGSILASDGQGGDMERLVKELDLLKSLGVNNLRVMVGSDGQRGILARVEPTLQVAPRVYNDTLLVGLDRFLVELGKRDMEAVLYLNNSWEWTGGYSQYLEWAGYGEAPIPAVVGYKTYCDYVSQYHKSDDARALFNGYVEDIVTRVNSITGKPYSEDPAIFCWQIGNEPRPFGEDNFESFAEWIEFASDLIKHYDPNHLVSIGTEGLWGCEGSMELWERISSCKSVDVLNCHIWPLNWSWVNREDLAGTIQTAIDNTGDYIDQHLEFARKIRKPLTIEEFGFPRDGFVFGKDAPTTLRDRYYSTYFERVIASSQTGDQLAGVNFWGWGGYANPSSEHVYWQRGDDYTGDPAQEEQGLNSVFASDSSTVALIRETNEKLN